MDNEKEVLIQLGEQKINVGRKLIERLNVSKNIPGISRIQRKIKTEILSLQNGISLNRLTMNNIFCSNLVYFTYLVNVLEKTENVCEVDFPIKSQRCQNTSIRIDIVADKGATWMKVIARNSKGLSDTAHGHSNYGAKSILDHAKSYASAAASNLYCFKRPKVIFDFSNLIDEELRRQLTEMGIIVRFNGNGDLQTKSEEINKLNLDVTTMMAFVSNMTCETCDITFGQKILNDQACQERLVSTKAILDNLFQGKELIACQTAKNSFLEILTNVGGPKEKERGQQLLDTITVLPDLNEYEESLVWSERKLQMGKKIQKRSYKIFSFGMFHKALSVTANKRFIEAAKMQDISIPSIIHDSRALTEQKQSTCAKSE